MRRAPTTFALVLGLVALALLLALGLSNVLSGRLVHNITVKTNGHLATATALAVATLAEGDDARTRKTFVALRGIGVEMQPGPPPQADPDVPPAMRDIGQEIGRLLGDPSRVVLTGTPDRQIWIRSVHDPRRWVVIHALNYRQEVIDSRALLTVIAGLIALVIAACMAHLLTRPLAKLAAHAPALLAGDSAAARLRGTPREVRRLAQAIADAGERLREAAGERELMLAGVSHDLRTPLARLRVALELGDADDPQRREAMIADLQQLDDALEQCLVFVREGRNETLREIDLAALIGQLLALRGQPDEWRYDGPDVLMTMARPSLLRRAIGNLMDNAERYGAAPFTVELERLLDGIRIQVADHGPGVPESLLPKLGKPFVRGDISRGGRGSGLGLSIAMRAAALHGGRMELRNGKEGGFIAVLSISPLSGGGVTDT